MGDVRNTTSWKNANIMPFMVGLEPLITASCGKNGLIREYAAKQKQY